MSFFQTLFSNLKSFKHRWSAFAKHYFYGLQNAVFVFPIIQSYSFNWNKPTPAKLKNQPSSTNPLLVYKYLRNFSNVRANWTWLLLLNFWTILTKSFLYSLNLYKRLVGDGFIYLRGLLIIFSVDALIADDEPLWEPLEWSLLQSWILFIFLFAWIGENLISSRYGSYTGRDKRVWFSWYKTYWLIEGWYVLSMGMASLWVIVPHYYEVTYGVSFMFSWWNWYSRVFIFKFISIFTLILLISYILQISIRWSNWKKSFYLILSINFFLAYLLYTQFFISFFAYFTDPRWYSKTRLIDYVQLSHEPSRWGWGDIKRDHFTHHRSKTVFWYKNDGPFASAFFFYNVMFFLALFTLYFYWIALIRRVYTTQEITFTFTTYCVSSLKQFFYFFMLMLLMIFIGYFCVYARLPNEFMWALNPISWFDHFVLVLRDYPAFIWALFS